MVGKTIYVFDDNRRVYAKDENGHSSGGPIYREHWRPCKVTGETTQSWLLDYGNKISKKELREGKLNGVKLSLQEVEEVSFIRANDHKVAQAIYALKDYAKFKAIFDILEKK